MKVTYFYRLDFREMMDYLTIIFIDLKISIYLYTVIKTLQWDLIGQTYLL